MQSTGTFFAAARLAGATHPPAYILSRSIGLQVKFCSQELTFFISVVYRLIVFQFRFSVRWKVKSSYVVSDFRVSAHFLMEFSVLVRVPQHLCTQHHLSVFCTYWITKPPSKQIVYTVANVP